MVWGLYHSHGMYSGISLDKWASVSSTGGLEDSPDFGTVKNNHAGHRLWAVARIRSPVWRVSVQF